VGRQTRGGGVRSPSSPGVFILSVVVELEHLSRINREDREERRRLLDAMWATASRPQGRSRDEPMDADEAWAEFQRRLAELGLELQVVRKDERSGASSGNDPRVEEP
jgi:hypothetical protein